MHGRIVTDGAPKRGNTGTGAVAGWPLLNRELFELLGQQLGDRVMLIAAEQDGQLVAAALNLRGRDALYGRYWGRLNEAPYLHFEVCYYRAIELASELGLPRVEAGAQGPHKLQRGYTPAATFSAHWLAHPALSEAVGAHLERERREVSRQMELLRSESPFKGDRAEARARLDAAAE